MSAKTHKHTEVHKTNVQQDITGLATVLKGPRGQATQPFTLATQMARE